MLEGAPIVTVGGLTYPVLPLVNVIAVIDPLLIVAVAAAVPAEKVTEGALEYPAPGFVMVRTNAPFETTAVATAGM